MYTNKVYESRLEQSLWSGIYGRLTEQERTHHA